MTDTIHPYADSDSDPAAPPMFVWRNGYGSLHLIGGRAEVVSLFQALSQHLDHGILAAPIDAYDPAWGGNCTIAQAVQEAISYGYGDDARQVADSIRAAARNGRITGARVVDGKWSLPKRTLRHWLMRSQEETRGRPRQTAHVLAVLSADAPPSLRKLLAGFGQETTPNRWEMFVTLAQLQRIESQCGYWVTFDALPMAE